MSHNNNLDQFDDLIDLLQQADERPFAPRAFKNKLRTQLLDQYGKPKFSIATLGRWAGTAVAFSILGFIIFYAWGILSRPELTGSPIQLTRPIPPTQKPTIAPFQPESAASSFQNGPLLRGHQLSATQVNPGDTLEVTLLWEGEPTPNTSVAVHLTDTEGKIFAQADQPLTAEMILILFMPDSLADGVYELVVIKYDAASGLRQDSFLLQEIEVGTAVRSAVVSGTEGNGLTLRSEPGGQDLGILEEGSIVHLNDEPRLESEGLIWQSVSTTIGKGWVVADFLEYPEGYRSTETIPLFPDSLWIVKATQLPRNNPDEAITLEVTIAYELVAVEDAVITLSFIHLSREVAFDSSRYPAYNALGDEFPVQAGIGLVTIIATIEPEQITSELNSNEFMLMTRLWKKDENGDLIFGPILIGYNEKMTFDVQSVEEITYP